MNAKQILSEILGYYKYKVDNDLCTSEEMEEARRALESNMRTYGTIDDFATFYGKSKDAVNGVIKRRMLEKPRRNVVLYRFDIFRRLIPESWRKSDCRKNN